MTAFSSDNESFARMKGVSTQGVPIDSYFGVWGSWFPPAVKTKLVVEGEHWRVRVAHWFLILLFLIPWIGFLAWRIRKQRKQMS